VNILNHHPETKENSEVERAESKMPEGFVEER